MIDQDRADAIQRILVEHWHTGQCGCTQATYDDEGFLDACASKDEGFNIGVGPFTWTPEAVLGAIYILDTGETL